jgi:hypothetical protein
MTYALSIVRALLALIFLFTGGMKLVLPLKVLTAQMPLSGLFIAPV